MGQEVFVDVAYSGLDVGRRLKLREVGPRTAYLEHGTPMPVGAELVLRNDEGLVIQVTVIRVHEQVAGADMPPGMRIRAADLSGSAAEWWGGLVHREDPVIPEPELPPPLAVPLPGPDLPPPDPGVEAAEIPAGDTAVMRAVLVPEGEAAAENKGNGAAAGEDRSPQTSSRTIVMSAVEISQITETAPESGTDEEGEGAESDADSSAPGSNGDELRSDRARGRRRRRRR